MAQPICLLAGRPARLQNVGQCGAGLVQPLIIAAGVMHAIRRSSRARRAIDQSRPADYASLAQAQIKRTPARAEHNPEAASFTHSPICLLERALTLAKWSE
jgi:hypothetical protein